MINDFTQYAIYLMPGSTDMRKQINGLAVIAENEMTKDVFSQSLFLFCNRGKTHLKILYWDKNGFCLWVKRLEKHRFPWPVTESDYKNINYEELKMLLNGIDFFNAHENLKNIHAS
jgi:transposase